MSEDKIQIFINKKEMPYSHQNMARAINSFLPYLTNDDLTELGQDILDLMNHREKKEAISRLEVKQHSKSVVQEHEMAWGDEYENNS